MANEEKEEHKPMTLDEAISHAKEVAASKCDECGKEHQKLAEWLSELNGYKDKTYIEPDFLIRNGFEKRTFDFLYCDMWSKLSRKTSTGKQGFGVLRFHISTMAIHRRSTSAQSGNSVCSSLSRD